MIEATFREVFEAPPAQSLFTPGRVNLIGEHTDYNGGMVLPTAIALGPTIAFSPRNDNRVRLYSDKFDEIAERRLTDSASGHWSDYITGAIILARETDLIKSGANIAIKTDLPFGAGLSSSAAVTVGVLKIIRELSGNALSDNPLSDTDIALLARRVENDFIGMPCGIMDQMTVAIAKPEQALVLDTKSLDYSLIKLPESHHMAVIHSGQFRQLSEGRYKIRKEECDVIKAFLGRDDICLISDTDYETLSALPDHIQRRARHCMTDHRRTVQAANLLAEENMQAFGRLMTESHVSQRDDFEISLPQVDSLVDDAVKFGALGARQTGGGFGGCIVACTPNDGLDDWKKNLLSRHPDAFYVC